MQDDIISLNTNDIPWEKLQEGIWIKKLAEIDDAGRVFTIYKIDPDTKLEKHAHKDYEWVYVLEGVFEDEFNKYPQGTFIINKKGSVHVSGSTQGCQLLVLQTAEREAE